MSGLVAFLTNAGATFGDIVLAAHMGDTSVSASACSNTRASARLRHRYGRGASALLVCSHFGDIALDQLILTGDDGRVQKMTIEYVYGLTIRQSASRWFLGADCVLRSRGVLACTLFQKYWR